MMLPESEFNELRREITVGPNNLLNSTVRKVSDWIRETANKPPSSRGEAIQVMVIIHDIEYKIDTETKKQIDRNGAWRRIRELSEENCLRTLSNGHLAD